ncbi:MAG: hypothetical protein IJP68_10100 [Selenomonadaceae bacterium]|nr:hypothetical protein [Selenomonadaceae bacterium]
MATVIPRLTKAGAILLAKAIGGTQLTFTRGAFGDAAGHDTPTAKQIDNFNALLNERMSLPITGFKVENNQAIITLLVKNEEITAGFRVVEGGIFARDVETGDDVLYAYFYDGDEADFMPAGNAGIQLEYEYDFITAVSNAENVTAIVQRIYQGLTQEDLDAHIASSLPHPNWSVVTFQEFLEHSLSTDPHPNYRVDLAAHSLSSDPHPNWEVVALSAWNDHINSSNPHPNFKIKAGTGLKKSGNTFSLAVASAQSLGGVKVGKNLYMDGDSLNAESSELDVDGRLKQLEINQANLYILLEALNKFGVQGNLIMTEDFQTLKYTNNKSANVTIAAEGKDFKVDDISFIRPTGSVVVTNGLAFNKLVTVDSIKSESGEYILTADSKLNETTSRGKIYRSSVTIRDNKAYGAGLMKTKKQSANKLWKGEGSSDSQTLEFNAYPSLASGNSTLDGDWSLTSDGYFTLD